MNNEQAKEEKRNIKYFLIYSIPAVITTTACFFIPIILQINLKLPKNIFLAVITASLLVLVLIVAAAFAMLPILMATSLLSQYAQKKSTCIKIILFLLEFLIPVFVILS